MSRTSKFTRYRTPVVKQKLIELEQHRENLELEADDAWVRLCSFNTRVLMTVRQRDFQSQIAEDYVIIRRVANNLAIADVLFSLALHATRPEYCKPTFVNENVLEIENGRHPMVEELRDDPFVPNTLKLGGEQTTSKIITGPNMGGRETTCALWRS